MRSEVFAQRAPRVLDEEDAWALVQGLARRAKEHGHASGVEPGPPWDPDLPLSKEARQVLELCAPLCVGPGAANLVVAHLGQSLDGRVAVPPGASRFITGAEDVRHTHRLRALFDAVIVGATTIAVDDPQLTTRLVPGESPVRVVLDPRGRLPHACRVFSDPGARSLVVTTEQGARHYAALGSRIELCVVGAAPGLLPLTAVRAALAERGLPRLFVEGGGFTVSRFLEEGLVGRLHIAVAPKIIGTGEPAIQLEGTRVSALQCRRFVFGEDVLFDFELRPASDPRRGRA